MFNTGNPPQDAQDYLRWLDLQPSALSEQATCDLCNRKGDLIDMIPAPDKGGYYCEDCFNDGDVESYLVRLAGTGMTEEEIKNYIKQNKPC